jgi:hypothetical protein
LHLHALSHAYFLEVTGVIKYSNYSGQPFDCRGRKREQQTASHGSVQ